ncbi:hypothetical protein L202_05140 [Cryptococcus amylolentus CBS 6039]|uniref:Uncharacterized protein n=2 Tax=Cryptococcus amylolentus TaxID=104669 RepID=A0A1E3HNY5_9TREE|nr:hypothetical protein L202_05140 [Cryptococcus amylolentus CBS 6039]ODN78060.1 hypothetical protein L202_05140 [Cryptococcus amylolentus CBS 6039]ODO06007.1 hypothetical protein I350_05068 [Cryptococcus amylolentus CBS 6273]
MPRSRLKAWWRRESSLLDFLLEQLMFSLFKRSVPAAMGAPKYVYKIVPHSSVDPRFTFPVPIPSSHQFLLPLDLQDRFIHLSSAAQIPKTLGLFFKEAESVVLLRVETERIGAWKKLEWVMEDQEKRTGDMPYLCAHAWPVPLEGEYVESFKEVHRKGGDWDAALAQGDLKSWLV